MSDIIYAGAHWVGPAAADNYMIGRQGTPVSEIIWHHTATDLAGAIATFVNPPATSGAAHSAHFIVDLAAEFRDGLLGRRWYAIRTQVVDTADTAYGAANWPANLRGINVEVVQLWDFGAGVKLTDFSDAQYASCLELAMILAADNPAYRLDLDHNRRHDFYTSTTCPADLDVARILTPPPPTGAFMALNDQQQADLYAAVMAIVARLGGGSGRASLTADMWGLWNGTQYAEDGTPVAGGAKWPALATILAAIKATPAGTATDLSPVLAELKNVEAGLADLKAHPAVVADPAAAAKIAAVESALKAAGAALGAA